MLSTRGGSRGGAWGAVAPPLRAAADDVMHVSCTQLLRAPRSARSTQTLTVRGLRLLKGQGQRAKRHGVANTLRPIAHAQTPGEGACPLPYKILDPPLSTP